MSKSVDTLKQLIRTRDRCELLKGFPLIEDPCGANAYIQRAYEEHRRRGESHTIAEMLAYRFARPEEPDEIESTTPRMEQRRLF